MPRRGNFSLPKMAFCTSGHGNSVQVWTTHTVISIIECLINIGALTYCMLSQSSHELCGYIFHNCAIFSDKNQAMKKSFPQPIFPVWDKTGKSQDWISHIPVPYQRPVAIILSMNPDSPYQPWFWQYTSNQYIIHKVMELFLLNHVHSPLWC